MSDVIKLLPAAVANQIAAGEVIQRPASAVKELLENAIDAGADSIRLIIKDAGKTLIQVVDNGVGMTETDASLCFERHATSKIQQASDLFSIRTMGFRGEALASVAAIARVELKTRTVDEQIGTEVIAEAAKLQSRNPCNCPKGTSISVKNLFFNTPARRNFLKSDNVEKRHILHELQRIAIARPDISFHYYQNNQLTHQLNKSKLKQRIANLFGSNYNQRLVPVDENTQIVKISGFVGKPEYAKKVRGEQFFYVNQRYIRSPYLNHAVESAFKELIPEGAHPSFFLFLETAPEQIDVNVHPTKTEIKFQDDNYIYQIIKAAVKRSLGSYNLSPSIDFEQESAFDDDRPVKDRPIKPPSITINPDYNPFETGRSHKHSTSGELPGRISPKQWEKLYPADVDLPVSGDADDGKQFVISPDWESREAEENGQKKFFQLHARYILTPVKSGIMIIDQQRAHERILFEKFNRNVASGKAASQQLLFSDQIRLTENEAEILKEIIEVVQDCGFSIRILENNEFEINAIPAGLSEDLALEDVLEGLIENVHKNREEFRKDMQNNVLRAMAKRMAVRHGKALTEEEMSSIVNNLFACEIPQFTPSGKIVLQIISHLELSERFK